MPLPNQTLAGIFVGGASRRMGSPKALLTVSVSPGGEPTTLLERTVAVVRAAGLAPVIVGRRPELPALDELMRALDVPVLRDAAADAGPLGGLVALLEAAHGPVLALPCDLPAIEARHLRQLLEAPTDAAVVAARRDGHWEPLPARYTAERVLPVARRRLASRQLALQALLDEVGATELPREEADAAAGPGWLDDWDTPEDMVSP